jgi:hypothetical protein
LGRRPVLYMRIISQVELIAVAASEFYYRLNSVRVYKRIEDIPYTASSPYDPSPDVPPAAYHGSQYLPEPGKCRTNKPPLDSVHKRFRHRSANLGGSDDEKLT